MKHQLLILFIIPFFVPNMGLGQADLIVRELTHQIGNEGETPLKDILRTYDARERLVAEVTHIGTLDKKNWRKEAVLTFEYDEADRVIRQTRTFYKDDPVRIIIEDELKWSYNEAGQTIHYQLFRENYEAERQEGFSYDYFFQGECATGFLAYTWDETVGEFVFDFENQVTNGVNCLPETVDNGTYRYRYAYEFDADQRPIKETTWRGASGSSEEELISVFSIKYGEGYEVRIFDGILNGLLYVDSTVYLPNGNPLYKLERSNLRGAGNLEPSQEIIWEYDALGNEVVQTRNQSWNALDKYWLTSRIDSVISEEWGRRDVFEFLSRSAPNQIDRLDRSVTVELLRCDDLPEWRITEYFQNGSFIGIGEQTRITYAGPPACNPWVDEDLMEVYPNPATEEVQLRAPILGAGNSVIRIYAQDGRRMVEMQKECFSNGICIDVSTLPEGLFLVTIERGGMTLSRKLLIQRP